MFVFKVVSFSVLITVIIIWTGETLFYRNMFGEVLKNTDPNFDVYDMAIDNGEFKLLNSTIHATEKNSAVRYIDYIDISILKKNFYHIHSKKLDDRRVIKGSNLYNKISKIKKSVAESNKNKWVERSRVN